MKEIRLVVAGTRDAAFEDIPIVLAAIKRWSARNGRPTHVVCGGCNGNKKETSIGIDLIGAHLALQAKVRIDFLPAEWDLYGDAAGPRRNGIMIVPADGLVVIRHEWSRGSADVLEKAIRKWGHGSPRIEDVIIEKRANRSEKQRYDTKEERKKWGHGP